MKGHHIHLFWSAEDDCYVADLPDFEYCSAFPTTQYGTGVNGPKLDGLT